METAREMIHTTAATKTDLAIGADNEGQYIILKFRYTDKGHRHITMKPEFARALRMQLGEFMQTNFPAKTDNDLQARASICAQKETAVLLGVLQCKLIAAEAERDRLMVVENLVKDVLEEMPCEDDCSSMRELRSCTTINQAI